MIVGLSGYAGAGKDEAARALVKHRGFERIAFADVLRDIAVAIDPYVMLDRDETFMFERLSDVVNGLGWDVAKNRYPDVRRLLQRIGTEAGREILGENIWVDTALARIKGDAVITDMRFPNELQAVEEQDGITIRIERPGVGPRNNHASETSLTDHSLFRYVIHNDGSIEDLHEKVLEVTRDEWETEAETTEMLRRINAR